MTAPRSANPKTLRAKAVLEFWERRLDKKLTNRDAAEMQSNVEGVLALLAQWDRADREASRAKPRKKHTVTED